VLHIYVYDISRLRVKYAGSVTRGCTSPGRPVSVDIEVLTVAPRFLEKPCNVRLGCRVCGERLAVQGARTGRRCAEAEGFA